MMDGRQLALDYLAALKLSVEEPNGRFLALDSIVVNETVERLDEETQVVITKFTQIYRNVE